MTIERVNSQFCIPS